MGPIGAARVAYKDGGYMVNPTIAEMEGTDLDLIMAGTANAVMMVESQANELSEDIMLGAVMEGHKAAKEVIDFIIEFAEICAKEPWDYQPPDYSDLMPRVREQAEAGLRDAYNERVKQARVEKINATKDAAKAALAGEEVADPMDAQVLGGLLKDLESDIVRNAVIDTGERIDGRDTKTVRPIVSEVGILPRTHGSALFTRGETQAIVVATLGTRRR